LSNVGTSHGDREEIHFVKNFNKGMFPDFCNEHFSDIRHVYAVHVRSNQFSKATQRKVKPKADAFLVGTQEDLKQFLVRRDFYIEERDLSRIECEKLYGSGITIKRPDSNSYQYHKFTVTSFVTTFKDRFLGAGATMYISSEDASKNPAIMNLWGTDESTFASEFSARLGISTDNISQNYHVIQNWCLKKIKERILNEESLKDVIFCGREVFDSPYFVSYAYFHGQLSSNLYDDFYVSQGSGRQKNPTIVIKPR